MLKSFYKNNDTILDIYIYEKKDNSKDCDDRCPQPPNLIMTAHVTKTDPYTRVKYHIINNSQAI